MNGKPAESRDHTILVVDDNRELLQIIRHKLTLDGYDVLTAETGDEAVTMLRSGALPDLLLTDAVMPGEMQRRDLARYVKTHLPRIPIVMMSGYIGLVDLSASEAVEIDGFLAKPLQLSVLSRQVGKLLDETRTKPGQLCSPYRADRAQMCQGPLF